MTRFLDNLAYQEEGECEEMTAFQVCRVREVVRVPMVNGHSTWRRIHLVRQVYQDEWAPRASKDQLDLEEHRERLAKMDIRVRQANAAWMDCQDSQDSWVSPACQARKVTSDSMDRTASVARTEPSVWAGCLDFRDNEVTMVSRVETASLEEWDCQELRVRMECRVNQAMTVETVFQDPTVSQA